MSSECCMIWGAGYCGGIALDAYGADRVICFGDSDERNIGVTRWGKSIISYEEMILRSKSDNIRIIAASEDYAQEMEKKLIDEGIDNYDLFVSECAKDIIADKRAGINPISHDYKGKSNPLVHDELRQFYKIHDGQRVFLIGNGPSLRVEDLDKLHSNHEICFGFNNIHSIFCRTDWRPDYYGISDYYGFLMGKEKLSSVPGTHFLWDLFSAFFPELKRNASNYFFRFIRKGYPVNEMPDFSCDASDGLNLGYSTTYDIGLQMAAYMGAGEIYLLGMDHYQPNKKSFEGNHFEGYLSDPKATEDKYRFYPAQKPQKGYDTARVERAFECAERYSREHGFRIFNSTRGGKLEVFERVSFDDLMS